VAQRVAISGWELRKHGQRESKSGLLSGKERQREEKEGEKKPGQGHTRPLFCSRALRQELFLGVLADL